MGEKLKPLEALEKVRNCKYPFARDNQEAFDIIEKALTDYQHFNQLYMPSLRKAYSLEEMEKSLKALDIIKEKTNLTITNDGKKVLVFVVLENQEEFNLLKEVIFHE